MVSISYHDKLYPKGGTIFWKKWVTLGKTPKAFIYTYNNISLFYL